MTAPAEFRGVFRRHAAGVVVITADAGGGPVGFTATSLSSMSLSPPLLGFAIARNASSWPAIVAAGSVMVNFLAEDQSELANRFATSNIDRFAPPLPWSRAETGEPQLDEAAALVRACVDQIVELGDHYFVVARGTSSVVRHHTPPLVYHDGEYTTVHALQRTGR